MSEAKDSFLLCYPNFSLLLLGRLLSTVAMLTQSVTLGWQVYSIARLEHSVEYSAFLVGMIGLVQFVPMFAFVLLAGETADRYDRRKILIACSLLQVACSAGLAALAGMERPSLVGIFAIAALFGVGRAFTMPASASLGPMLVPRDILPRAIGWNTLAMQAGMVLGPWLGGVLCAISRSGRVWHVGGIVPLRPAWRCGSSLPTRSRTIGAARGSS
ncbi:MAG: MFS transporter [Hyphomicrobium sp.]|nr:MFS transporter [Hyphomicrobium sp.]